MSLSVMPCIWAWCHCEEAAPRKFCEMSRVRVRTAVRVRAGVRVRVRKKFV